MFLSKERLQELNIEYVITVHSEQGSSEIKSWTSTSMLSELEMIEMLDPYVQRGSSAVLSIGTFGRYPEPMVEVVRHFDKQSRKFKDWLPSRAKR